uniref:Uncharacterized protein n=1 Tax=Arundo donax TaxID=35708 RepID=A0A0A9CE22_ARUDO
MPTKHRNETISPLLDHICRCLSSV